MWSSAIGVIVTLILSLAVPLAAAAQPPGKVYRIGYLGTNPPPADWWDALRQDAGFTVRSWRRQPGFALGSVLVLALGLGASTAMFSALDRILFQDKLGTIKDEIGGVLLYLIRLADVLSVDLTKSADNKIEANWQKIPRRQVARKRQENIRSSEMRLYAGMSTKFVRDTTHNRIADKLTEAFVGYYRYRPSSSEIGSWRKSLRAMSHIVVDAKFVVRRFREAGSTVSTCTNRWPTCGWCTIIHAKCHDC